MLQELGAAGPEHGDQDFQQSFGVWVLGSRNGMPQIPDVQTMEGEGFPRVAEKNRGGVSTQPM